MTHKQFCFKLCGTGKNFLIFFHKCHCTLLQHTSTWQSRCLLKYLIFYYLSHPCHRWLVCCAILECYLFISLASLPCGCIFSCFNICYISLHKYVHITTVIPKTWFQHRSFDLDVTISVACFLMLHDHSLQPHFLLSFDDLLVMFPNNFILFLLYFLYFIIYY